MEAVVRPGIGRGFVLLYNGHRYQKNKTTESTISWRCWQKDCRGRAKTNIFEIVDGARPRVIEVTVDHEHAEQGDRIGREAAFANIREQIEGDASKPLKRIYNEVAGRYEDDGEDFPTYESIRTRMLRVRQESVPPIPRRIEDVQVGGEWARTWNGHSFLSLRDNAVGVLIFVTVSCLEILSEINTLFVDGTFKSSPAPYTQLVTLHGRYHGNVLTLAYILMTGKRLCQYRRALRHLKDEVASIGQVFVPTVVIADFEVAIRAAFTSEFPGIRVRGCYFHFTQSLWRKVQELGLVVPYNNDRRLQRVLRKVFSIGYLPVAVVRHNLALLRNSRQTTRAIALYPATADFFDYVFGTYIVGPFPAPTWNVFDRAMEFRTTNAVEGFHNKWNRDVGVIHPSLWHFLRCLKDDERKERVRIRQARRGELVPIRRRKWRRLEARITSQKALYNDGLIGLVAYWRAVTYAVKAYR